MTTSVCGLAKNIITMNLQGFYNEETLNELLDNKQISKMEYIYHHSPEMKEDFVDFCHDSGLEMNESSAQKYMEYRRALEETADV